MQSKRYDNIDVLKGLGIILVLLTHINAALSWERFYTAFYMPLFFWASGYLYHNSPGKSFLNKKIKTLIFPYLIAAVGYMVLDFHRFGFSLTFTKKLLWGVFFYPTTDAMPGYGAALWFIPCLFVVEVSFWLLQNTIDKRYHTIIVTAVTGLGFILAEYFSGQIYRLPWCIDTATMAIGIFYFGYLCRSFELEKFMLKIKTFPLIISLFFLSHFCRLNSISMWANIYGDKFLFLFNAVSGVVIMDIIVLKIIRCKNNVIVKCMEFFKWIGKYSTYVYLIHSAVIWGWTYAVCIYIANARLRNSILFVATLATSVLFLFLLTRIKEYKNKKGFLNG